MPYTSSNMPSSIFLSSFCSELLRIARCTTNKPDFITSSDQLIARMIKQTEKECKRTRIANKLTKLFSKHEDTFGQFFNNKHTFLDTLYVSKFREINK